MGKLLNAVTTNYLFSTTERVFAGVGIAVFSIGCFIVGFFNPTTAGFFPACPLLATTGMACPGCGLTRGFHSLFHGDIFTAISYNALIPIYCLILLYIFTYLFSVVIRGRGLNINLFSPIPLFTFLGLSLIFGVLRNIPVEPFTFFFP